ncbi:Mitochondrial protein Pet127 [Metarhizium robertsii ARSEF 23]|uniref:Mitochondrial protein Pet127 n=1 Tax=Metarhizium robertsii (strain ARSEF 23 / ATCC MYA-3075) TaxID=655844 RepID=E9ELM9_METRA|nr:Mitochondrial protein Pet127 [Metarhizium robertsii ARSEF 23]EFZ04463.1 Mitochondrial protein Pet127 [Metarhizium robertsii ARSEF 23]
MLRVRCCSGQLARSLHCTRAQQVASPLRRSRPLSTTQYLATDPSDGKPASSTQTPRKQDRDEQKPEETQKKWASFFKPETVGQSETTLLSNGDSTPAEARDQSNKGIWTTLRSRMEVSKDNEATETTVLKNNEKDADTATNDGASEPTPKKGASKSKRTRGKAALDVKVIRPHKLKLKPVKENASQQLPPHLSYNLDRVLFNPGVYHMQDHRSGVFNFDPYLASIMPVDEFDFDALKEYTTSSKDSKLRELCAAHGLKYCGSTSSMTSILSHFHFLLSAWRRPNFDSLSKSLTPESLNFTALSRGPAAAFAHLKDGVYAIDADKEYDTENILSMLGKSMEKLLTLPKEEFEKYRRSGSHKLSEEEKNADEAYHFTTLGDFMMRSQLDAHDPRLPGSGVFDLKTRAVVSIRMDVKGYEKGVGYEIRKRFGQWESFEREYYDMIRAAFLKYSLQVRMGRMDGIFVAFHNTQRIFGFQYISLAEMDHAIHGTHDPRLGDEEFKGSIALLNDLMNRATQRFPGRTLRLHVETRPTKVPLTYFFVEPVTEEEMRKTQEAEKPSMEQLEREIQSLSREEREAESAGATETVPGETTKGEESDRGSDDISADDPQNEDTWKEMMSKVDEAVENESLGVRSIREAVQEALEHSGLLQNKTELESEKYLDELVSALTAHSSEVKESRQAQAEKDEETDEKKATDGQPDSDSTTLANLIVKVTRGINKNSTNLRPFERKVVDLATQARKADFIPTHERDARRDADDADDADDAELVESATDVDVDTKTDGSVPEEPTPELLGMYVTIRNKVNGEFVDRPFGAEKKFDWSVQYTITELPDKRAQSIYPKIKKRRKDVLATDPGARSADWYRMFKGKLPMMTKKGEKFRERRKQKEARSPVYVAWDKVPLPSNAGSS